MLIDAQIWLATKLRRALGIHHVLSRQDRLESLIQDGESGRQAHYDEVDRRLAGHMAEANPALNEAIQETVTNLLTRMDAMSSELSRVADRMNQPPVSQPDPRLDILSFADIAVLGSQRTRIRERHGALDIETSHPVAYDSPDHLVPWGTMRDNSREQRFNARLIGMIPGERLSLLDLGCSGGGLVRSMIEQGYLAAGVEGSDYSRCRLRAEWLTIPDFLFTADITKPFRLVSERAPDGVRFGVVTMWEVIEHIAEPDLPLLFKNIDAHLQPGGLVILSVSPNAEVIEGVELHQTVQQRPWWADFFTSIGWRDNPAIVEHFGDDLVRWEANAPNSFHFALSRAGETLVLTSRMRHLTKP